jgi:hypothetical protein
MILTFYFIRLKGSFSSNKLKTEYDFWYSPSDNLKSTFGIDKKQDANYLLKSPNGGSPRHEPRRSKKENWKKRKPLQEYDSFYRVLETGTPTF